MSELGGANAAHSGETLRIGTAEREDAIKILGDHFASGRLRVDEYEQRVGAAVASQTRGELRALFDDLPLPRPAFLTPVQSVAPQTVVPPAAPAPVIRRERPGEPVAYSDKSRVAAGLLQIMFPFGTGRFYTGHTRIAVAQLLLVFVGVGVLWSLIDGVVLLAAGGTDPQGRPLRI